VKSDTSIRWDEISKVFQAHVAADPSLGSNMHLGGSRDDHALFNFVEEMLLAGFLRFCPGMFACVSPSLLSAGVAHSGRVRQGCGAWLLALGFYSVLPQTSVGVPTRRHRYSQIPSKFINGSTFVGALLNARTETNLNEWMRPRRVDSVPLFFVYR